jgi:hypothetical protein
MEGALQLRDLGIVTLSKAIGDNALGVAEQALGLSNSEIKKLFWCTLCSRCYTKSTAYRDRDRHLVQVLEGNRRDALDTLQRTLDEKYGMTVR